ncbi:hypothetical protein AUEXF2481DRAFT_275991 [Aureobasidium subglaciale EXF-2481]|uniref:Uncharacterized protein n=1 Tax=Aureobasidium subglaciale (strain EXF-2481) TaxID=1043005 RepID=A0A074Y9I0_AURSE|nr:uncharacterized protein AUEXF2481DRAFT_275991 [Aureobasidium subglaciale EXF-2481]KEQ94433.1 hypothetical protein AUEXF2481DRAFT_275991 [Aureobasidium subglaciale EXF-2481]
MMAETTHDAFLSRMQNYTAPNPSLRNPRISKESSDADLIEAGYLADNHVTWGFVIYRTTYLNNEAWIAFLPRLHWWTNDSMEIFNGQDVLDKMSWTIFDNAEEFENASVADIREQFRSWTQTAVLSEQGVQEAGLSPRYRYCILVDSEALESCVSSPAPPDSDEDNQGWVKVIDKNFPLVHPLLKKRKEESGYEEIDGITEKHVGWVKCPYTSVMTEYYRLFRDLNGYMVSYRRPPAVIGYPWR